MVSQATTSLDKFGIEPVATSHDPWIGFSALTYDHAADAVTGDLGAALALAEKHAPSDPTLALNYWIRFVDDFRYAANDFGQGHPVGVGLDPDGRALAVVTGGGILGARIDPAPISKRCPMRDTHPLQIALGIQSPWFVAASDFNADMKRLDITLDFKAGARFACPECNAADCPVHDTTEKTSC